LNGLKDLKNNTFKDSNDDFLKKLERTIQETNEKIKENLSNKQKEIEDLKKNYDEYFNLNTSLNHELQD